MLVYLSIKRQTMGARTSSLNNYVMVSFQRKILRLKHFDNVQLLVEKFTVQNTDSPQHK